MIYNTVFEEDKKILKITVSDVTNMVSAQVNEIENSINVSSISISDNETGVVVFSFTLNDGASYYESLAGSEYTVHFVASETEVTENSISLLLPEGVSFDEITQEDCYYNNSLR